MTASAGFDRRTFMAAVVGAAVAAACGSDGEGESPDGGPAADLAPLPEGLPAQLFGLGVASGDPLPDSVILWTRLVADPLAGDGGMVSDPVPVRWQVASDEGFEEIVASGHAEAHVGLAHSVHVDVSGLEPGTWYWYRFTVGDRVSPVGRTRTAPAEGSPVDSLRFAFASCQDRQRGHWPAHEHLAQEDLDLVVFLGDYIYEYPSDPNAGDRAYRTPEAVDLTTYRQRWGEYKADTLLQASHARFPWVCTWDDHEVAADYAADGQPYSPGSDSFLTRRAEAYQAYYEHLPLRVDPPDGDGMRIYRQMAWGSLANFFVLDTRQYRSDQPMCPSEAGLDRLGPHCDEALDESRTMLGEEQEAWLAAGLSGSDAIWNVLAQQVVLSSLPIPFPGSDEVLYNLDQWDGYPAARRRLVEGLGEVSNPVAICGDIHAGGVAVIGDTPDDPESAPVAPMLMGSSISSSFPFPGVLEAAVGVVPNLLYANSERRGYVVCEVSPEEMRVEFRTVSTAAQPEADVSTDAVWLIASGDPMPREA